MNNIIIIIDNVPFSNILHRQFTYNNEGINFKYQIKLFN